MRSRRASVATGGRNLRVWRVLHAAMASLSARWTENARRARTWCAPSSLRVWLRPLGALLLTSALLAACTPLPTAPQVMVYPGRGKSLAEFDDDDLRCRSWAESRIGVSPDRAASDSTVSGAALGTLLGGAAGAALGAAAGNPAIGAAAGAGAGLLGGTSVGAARGQAAAWSVQRQYDIAYAQCMHASGNEVPRRPRRPPPPPPPPPPPGYYYWPGGYWSAPPPYGPPPWIS